MTYRNTALTACLLFLALAGCTQRDDFPVLTGPYLGQEPPGLTPAVFAPGIVSTDSSEGCAAFLNGGTVLVFEGLSGPDADWRYAPTYVTEFKEGRWTTPAPHTFNDLYPYNFTVAPDDRTLYFTSIRSSDGSGTLGDANIWVVEWTGEGWSTPTVLEAPVNTERFDNYPSVTEDGTVYFMRKIESGFGEDDIYRSALLDGRYVEVENLGPPINTEYPEIDSFVAADESYLIYASNMPRGYGEFDLYVAFQQEDGSWTEPHNLGPDINTGAFELRPSVTPNGKYFFFTRGSPGGEDAVYWVDAGIIQSTRPSTAR
jgi:hypothetical protein